MRTLEQARQDAQAEARELGRPVDIWQHTGGQNAKGPIPATGRYITRDSAAKPPKFAWTRVETIG